MPLPVFATVTRAYSFVFSNFGLICRLCWFPAFLSALPFMLGSPFSYDREEVISMSVEQIATVMIAGFAALMVSIFFTAMAMVAVHRLILFDDRQPGKTFVFSAGPAEFLFSIVPLAGFLLVGGLMVLLSALIVGDGRSTLMPFLLISAIVLGGSWVTARLVPLYPFIVMTERLAIREAWYLSHGSFWRILGVLVLASLPLALASMVISGIAASITNIPPHMADAPAAMAFSALAEIAIQTAVNIPMLAVWVAVLCFTTKALAGLAPDDLVRPPPGSE